jgi:phospholipid/cholesterol/gamma-HCH transport system ATP-binding protein
VGIGIQVEGVTKSFGPQRIWEDVTLDVPEGEVSVLLGPSGTGKSVFLKSLIGLLRPERGSIVVDVTNIIECSAKELYEIRTLFGVMFQDGALFGSMSLYEQHRVPSSRAHQEEGKRNPQHRHGEARARRSDR